MSDAATVALICAGYLLGSIPFGLIIGKLKGVDVRDVGSGNIGATNVARNLGKKVGGIVLLLDALKGAIPTLVGLRLVEAGKLPPEYMAGMAAAAIVGHCYPIWLRFQGGKGVATALGVFLVVDPLVAGIGIVIFAGLYLTFKIASIGSVSAAVAFPMMLYFLDRPSAYVHLGLGGAIIIIFKHRKNLQRLLRGEEMKV